MDAYDRLNAINEALISIDEKRTVMGRIARAAQAIGATARKLTRRGEVFTPKGAQSRSDANTLRMAKDVVASNQPRSFDIHLGGQPGKSAEARTRGSKRSVRQAVRRAGGLVAGRTRDGYSETKGTLDMATGRSETVGGKLDVGSVSNITMSGDQAGRIGSNLHLNPGKTKRLEKRATVVGTTDKMTPREKLKALRQMRRNRDASNYTRGMGDSFKRDKKALDSSPFSSGMTRRGASVGADRIERTGRSS